MVLELATEGALDAALQDASRELHQHDLYWPTALRIAQDATRGLSYLHNLQPLIAHRDLKARAPQHELACTLTHHPAARQHSALRRLARQALRVSALM